RIRGSAIDAPESAIQNRGCPNAAPRMGVWIRDCSASTIRCACAGALWAPRAQRAILPRYAAIFSFRNRTAARKGRSAPLQTAPECRVIDGLLPHCSAQCANYSALSRASHAPYCETLLLSPGRTINGPLKAARGRGRYLPPSAPDTARGADEGRGCPL